MSCPYINDLISNYYTLKELYLRWNKITNLGGLDILEGDERKESLAVLDLSYNNLGQRRDIMNIDKGFVEKLC